MPRKCRIYAGFRVLHFDSVAPLLHLRVGCRLRQMLSVLAALPFMRLFASEFSVNDLPAWSADGIEGKLMGVYNPLIIFFFSIDDQTTIPGIKIKEFTFIDV